MGRVRFYRRHRYRFTNGDGGRSHPAAAPVYGCGYGVSPLEAGSSRTRNTGALRALASVAAPVYGCGYGVSPLEAGSGRTRNTGALRALASVAAPVYGCGYGCHAVASYSKVFAKGTCLRYSMFPRSDLAPPEGISLWPRRLRLPATPATRC